MRFLHGKVKAYKGQTIEITFSEPTRVLVMNQKNFEKYKNNLTFTYYGGMKEDSPYSFKVPVSGEWYVVVEKGTYHEPKDMEANFKVVAPEKPQVAQSVESDDEDVSEDEDREEETENEDDVETKE